MAYDPTTRAGGWVTARSHRYIVLAAGGAFGTGAVLLGLLATGAPRSVVLVASVIGLLLLRFVLPKYGHLADRYRKGSVAEQAVGAVLDELRRDGFVLLHDVDDPRGGNVDHIVSGPRASTWSRRSSASSASASSAR